MFHFLCHVLTDILRILCGRGMVTHKCIVDFWFIDQINGKTIFKKIYKLRIVIIAEIIFPCAYVHAGGDRNPCPPTVRKWIASEGPKQFQIGTGFITIYRLPRRECGNITLWDEAKLKCFEAETIKPTTTLMNTAIAE